MARWNKERRLLDHEHSSFWKYRLQEVDEPNLMRDIFPYTEVARIDFDYKFVMPAPPKDMLLTDTTFRDGQQARPPYTVQQIVDIFDMLHRLSGPKGIVRQSEFFLYSDKDKEAVNRCRERGYTFPEITGWIRAHAKDLTLVKEMGLKETGILTSVSDYHIFLKLNWNRRKAMDEYLGIVKAALEMGIKPRCHLEDVTRADVYGFCVPFALELMKLRQESGIDIKLRLCDTMGYGVPYPGAALPRSVPKLVRAMIDDAGVPRPPAGMARPQRLPQGHGEQRHRLALRLRRGERRAVGVRRAHRQRPHRRHAHGIHFVPGQHATASTPG